MSNQAMGLILMQIWLPLQLIGWLAERGRAENPSEVKFADWWSGLMAVGSIWAFYHYFTN